MRLSQETITHRRGVIAGGNRPSMNGPVPVLRGSSCQNALVLISESRSARPRSENTSHTHAQLWPSFHSRARSSHTHLLLIFASWELGTPSASLQRLASCVPVSFKRLLIQGLLIYIYIYILQDTVLAQGCNDIMPSSHQFGAKEHIVMAYTSEATVCYLSDCLL
jgi:hypothetical protein